MKRILLAVAIIVTGLFTSPGVFAGSPAPHGFWPAYFGSASLNSQWGIWGEAQYRSYDFKGDLEQLLLRTALTYNLGGDNNKQVSQGYGYIRSEPYIGGTERKRVTEEHRLYQQLLLKHRYSRLHISHRYRAEERFIATDFKMRFRYLVSANLCINSKELKDGTFYLTASNEIFLHSKTPVFDRNRIYGGFGYGISKRVRLEAGNMWQLQEVTSRPQLQVILWHNIKL